MFEDSILDLLKVLIKARQRLIDIEASVLKADTDRALPWSRNAGFIDDRIDGFIASIGDAISEIDTFINEFPTEHKTALKLITKEY